MSGRYDDAVRRLREGVLGNTPGAATDPSLREAVEARSGSLGGRNGPRGVPLRTLGLTDAAIEDAILVAVLFNMYDRMADALRFEVPGPESFASGAKMLLRRGYV